MSTADQILGVLADVSDTPEVRQDLDLRLYDQHVLDSMGTVQLIIALSEAFGIEISPAEFDRDEWATPRLVISSVERRIGQ
ncbi:MAG: D-alanine--poly(phosphoribitol) ligase subunit DltC [Herpetosiphon sp.]